MKMKGSVNDSIVKVLEKNDMNKLEKYLSNLSLQTSSAKSDIDEIEEKLKKASLHGKDTDESFSSYKNIDINAKRDSLTATLNNEKSNKNSQIPLPDSPYASTDSDSNEEDDQESDDDSSEDEEIDYKKRGPLTGHRSLVNRFNPMYAQSRRDNVPSVEGFSVFEEACAVGPSIYDVKFDAGNGDNSCGEMSPQYINSMNLSPIYSSESISTNQTSFGFQTEFGNDDWALGTPQLPDTYNNEFGNNFISYQPITPPLSLADSPIQKDLQDSLFGFIKEDEKQKETEDLINIIATLDDSQKIKIPETDIQKLQNVCEGNDHIRDQMGIYLNEDEGVAQDGFHSTEGSPYHGNDFEEVYSFEPPLTPPDSVPPANDNSLYTEFSPASEDNNGNVNPCDLDDGYFRSVIVDVLDTQPEDLNIYLKNWSNQFVDTSYAKNIIRDRCNPSYYDEAVRRLSTVSDVKLCKKDSEGDTNLMIVYSKAENSRNFYENVFCLQERVLKIKLCCDTPIGKAKKCKKCGNSDVKKFYTSLSQMNNKGETALSCAIKTRHSVEIIDYILQGIAQCEQDFKRTFDDKGKYCLSKLSASYPSLDKLCRDI